MTSKSVLITATCVIFAIFFSNVVAGAAGLGVFLSDVAEMLTLFAACTCFVLAMLAHERSAASTGADAPNNDT